MRRSKLPANSSFAVLGLTLFSVLMFTGPAQAVTEGRGPAPKDMTQALPYRMRLPIVMLHQSGAEWQNRINRYRLASKLPPVYYNADWTYGAAAHARYIVNTGTLLPYEDPLSGHYTPEGNLAANFSLQMGQTTQNFSDAQVIDFWLRSPFQALSMLDPEWNQTGYGSYRAPGGLYQTGAVLDVVRGYDPAPAVTYPIYWPGNGVASNLKEYSGADNPDPLLFNNCPGSRGAPIILQVGNGSNTVAFTTSTPTIVLFNGGPIYHCAFSATEFSIPNDSDATSYGKQLLDQRDAVVIIPTNPLANGSYTVTITLLVNNVQRTFTWSFTVVN